jgi:hypothetical protein
MGRTEFQTRRLITSEPWLAESKPFQRERNGALLCVHAEVDVTGEICTWWDERESTWRKSWLVTRAQSLRLADKLGRNWRLRHNETEHFV